MSKVDAILGDADIRPALRSWLHKEHAHNSDTVLIEELGLCRGQVRVDLAVVNGQLHGYEIKSDRDTLRRLDRQIDFYSRVFDLATLVVGDRHLDEALQGIPDWWGVLRIDTSSEPMFEVLRRGGKNPGRNPRSLVELLWLDEAVSLLARRNAARGVRGKPRCVVWDRLCEHLDVHEIAAAVRSHLKARSATPSPPPP